jgi:hypothetical protein
MQAGAVVANSGNGPCLGVHQEAWVTGSRPFDHQPQLQRPLGNPNAKSIVLRPWPAAGHRRSATPGRQAEMARVVLNLSDDSPRTSSIPVGSGHRAACETHTRLRGSPGVQRAPASGRVPRGQHSRGRKQLRLRLFTRAGSLMPQGARVGRRGPPLRAHLPAELDQRGPASGDLPGDQAAGDELKCCRRGQISPPADRSV